MKFRPSIWTISIGSLVTLLMIFTLLGVLFSGKRNSHGFFISENINSSDLPKRMAASFQTYTINLFLNEIISKDITVEKQKCYVDTKNDFRKRSNIYFFLPNGFKSTIGSYVLSNGNEPGMLFLDTKSKDANRFFISNCGNFWLISGR